MFISTVIWDACSLLCVVIGVPGHILQGIIMLNRTNRKDPVSFYFVVISVWELIYLIGILWIRFVSMSLIQLDPRQVFSCGIVYTMINGPTIASNLLLACLSIDRSMMILYPTRYRFLVSRCHVLKRISVVTLVVILIMIPAHFSFSYDPKSSNNFICELRPFIRRWEANLWPLIRTVLFAFAPSLITCRSSLILLHNRFPHRPGIKRRLSTRTRRMQTLSILIALFSLFNLVATLPVCVLEFFIFNDHIVNQNLNCSIRRIRYKLLLNYFLSLMSLNYSLKFYARLIVSTPFRRDVLRLITCNLGDPRLLTGSLGHRGQQLSLLLHLPMTTNIMRDEKPVREQMYKS